MPRINKRRKKEKDYGLLYKVLHEPTRYQGLTENGAASYADVGDACVALFFKTVRGITLENLVQLLENAWRENSLTTLKVIFQTRDCRGGKGEKAIFYQSLLWLGGKSPETLLKNLEHIPFYGCWKDLLIFVGTDFETPALNLFVHQLRTDLEVLSRNEKNISLCAKWAPTENHLADTNGRAAHKLAKLLYPDSNSPLATYRKGCLVPLRKHLKVAEVFMCAQEWGGIQYSLVPSRCMHLSKNAFQRHDEDRFRAFLLEAASGKAKIQGKQMFPHELAKIFMRGNKEDLVAELQWQTIIKDLREKGSLKNALVLSDVSGSMSGTPMEVSIGLGLVISELTEPPFQNVVITFEETPRMFTLTGTTLAARVRELAGAPWGGSTNFQAALSLILQTAIDNQLPQDAMPKSLFVISDMQFNEADKSYKTNHQDLQKKFIKAGYQVPQIIYWNVRPNTVDFPATADMTGVVLLSGYSPSLMKLMLTGEQSEPESSAAPKQKNELTPLDMLRKAIDDERYERISL